MEVINNPNLKDFLIEFNPHYIRCLNNTDLGLKYDEGTLLKLRKNSNFEKVRSLNIRPKEWTITEYQELIKSIVLYKNRKSKKNWRDKNRDNKNYKKKVSTYHYEQYRISDKLREMKLRRSRVHYRVKKVIIEHTKNFQECLKEIKKQDYYKMKEKVPIRQMIKVDINVNTGLVILSYMNSNIGFDQLEGIFEL